MRYNARVLGCGDGVKGAKEAERGGKGECGSEGTVGGYECTLRERQNEKKIKAVQMEGEGNCEWWEVRRRRGVLGVVILFLVPF